MVCKFHSILVVHSVTDRGTESPDERITCGGWVLYLGYLDTGNITNTIFRIERRSIAPQRNNYIAGALGM